MLNLKVVFLMTCNSVVFQILTKEFMKLIHKLIFFLTIKL